MRRASINNAFAEYAEQFEFKRSVVELKWSWRDQERIVQCSIEHLAGKADTKLKLLVVRRGELEAPNQPVRPVFRALPIGLPERRVEHAATLRSAYQAAPLAIAGNDVSYRLRQNLVDGVVRLLWRLIETHFVALHNIAHEGAKEPILIAKARIEGAG